MSLTTQSYKGARDFFPEDKRIQKYMFSVLRKVVETFGYLEYDAPIIEPIELYLAKTSDEIVTEQTYNFLDRGGRHVTLRPEMTPTVSRMVAARRQELSYPARWYSIPNLWRYERPQHGRLREHFQLNVDLFGVSGIEADHEIMVVADTIMQAYGAKRSTYEIRVSSRAFVNWLLLEYLKLDHSQATAMIRLVDRLHKISEEEFLVAGEALLTPSQRESGTLRQLLVVLKAKEVTDLPLVTQQHPATSELIKLMKMLKNNRIDNAVFDPTLMRGFDYYTGIVFEVFDKETGNNRSMFGGGRYDGLVGEFGVQPLPTVGFGMGDVTLQNFLETHKLLPTIRPETDAVVILIGNVYEASQEALSSFRAEGVRLAVDTTGRKLDAQIRGAVKGGLSFALFIGEQELISKRYKLKNLVNGEEHEHSFERIVSILNSRHVRQEDL
ncbi:histidine--tRNA ligase [Candidatus Saccharibacteria bacterium]|nr:histidine--tRNA ligase [Candidatus Saccharibacteria bacterium]